MLDSELVLGLAALGHPLRLSLYRHLVVMGAAGSGPMALATAVGMPRTLVSYHLQPLVAAGLARSERRGRDVNYRVEPVSITKLATALLDLSTASATDDRRP